MNAKRNIVKALAACVSLALASFVFAADTITLNVASGSVTLSEALESAGSSIDAIAQGGGGRPLRRPAPERLSSIPISPDGQVTC